jgi:cephalosporin-C deacetylase-like acetyl esterase
MKGIFNHIRCVDFLVSRKDVSAHQIGVIGHSLGGHNAIFVSAFDQPLKSGGHQFRLDIVRLL